MMVDGGEIPIHYRVFQDRSGAWKGYDVVIENGGRKGSNLDT
jgi:ABC-type transporter MlaC component